MFFRTSKPTLVKVAGGLNRLLTPPLAQYAFNGVMYDLPHERLALHFTFHVYRCRSSLCVTITGLSFVFRLYLHHSVQKRARVCLG
jgi:hypothetical protein